jgi:prefoldin alpha subunit
MLKREMKLNTAQMISLYQNQASALDATRSQLAAMQNMLRELSIAEQALKEVRKARKGEEVLLSVGAGIFINAKLSSTNEVVASIGEGVLEPMGIKKALARLEEQKEQVNVAIKKLEKQERALVGNLANLERALSHATQAQRKDFSPQRVA